MLARRASRCVRCATGYVESRCTRTGLAATSWAIASKSWRCSRGDRRIRRMAATSRRSLPVAVSPDWGARGAAEPREPPRPLAPRRESRRGRSAGPVLAAGGAVDRSPTLPEYESAAPHIGQRSPPWKPQGLRMIEIYPCQQCMRCVGQPSREGIDVRSKGHCIDGRAATSTGHDWLMLAGALTLAGASEGGQPKPIGGDELDSVGWNAKVAGLGRIGISAELPRPNAAGGRSAWTSGRATAHLGVEAVGMAAGSSSERPGTTPRMFR